MPSTFYALELRQDGDVAPASVKQSAAIPTLKDLQSHLKKRTLPSQLATYPYGERRITMLGYSKGKEDDISQHQLPPPFEALEIYGTIILIAHTNKTTWDSSRESIVEFAPVDYELFYEKACSGELEEDIEAEADAEAEVDDGDIDADVHEEDDDAAVHEDEVEEEVDEDDALEGDLENLVEEDVEEEVEEQPRARASRKVVKPNPKQLQFQYKSELAHEPEVVEESQTVVQRATMINILTGLLSKYCDDSDIRNLERGIYNAALEEAKVRMVPLTWKHDVFIWIYTMISKRSAANFSPESYVGNINLIHRWQNGEFAIDKIGAWSSYDLNPGKWSELKEQQVRRDKRILEGNLSMATDRFRCSGCQKKMCSYYELQTRSADEPMTIFIKCLNCGKQWKQ